MYFHSVAYLRFSRREIFSDFAVDTLIQILSYSGILALVEFCSTIKSSNTE